MALNSLYFADVPLSNYPLTSVSPTSNPCSASVSNFGIIILFAYLVTSAYLFACFESFAFCCVRQ